MKSHITPQSNSRQKHWENHISCWQKSGLSKRQYCLNQKIAISTFFYWARKLRNDSERQSPTRFYPLAVRDAGSSPDDNRTSSGLRLSLCSDKFRVDLQKEFSERALEKLIATLEAL